MMKMVAKSNAVPNFVTSSQDFHIEFIKSVINLKTSSRSDIQARIISKRKNSGMNRRTGVASENRGIQFKIGELEHMSDDSHEKLSHESDESDDSSE